MPTSSTNASAARAERTRTPGAWRKRRRRARASASPSSGPLGKDDAVLADPELRDFIAHGAAAVLDHAEKAPEAIAHALAAHDEDGVRDGADVPGGHLAGDEVLELGLLGGDEQQRGHRGVVVSVGIDERAVLPHRE